MPFGWGCHGWRGTFWQNGTRNMFKTKHRIHGLFKVMIAISVFSCIAKIIILQGWIQISFPIYDVITHYSVIWLISVGCSTLHSNVKPILDDLCSGRQSCNLEMHKFWDLTEDWALTSSCSREIAHYLQARYTCMPGEQRGLELLGTEVDIIWSSLIQIPINHYLHKNGKFCVYTQWKLLINYLFWRLWPVKLQIIFF